MASKRRVPYDRIIDDRFIELGCEGIIWDEKEGESDYKIHKPRVEPHVTSEARCLECGESFGTYETKILRPRFREHTCFMRARSWMEGGVITGQIKKLEY